MKRANVEELAGNEETEFPVPGSGKFHIESSFNEETPEVKSMDRQVKQGRPTPLYELAQGQVDYGRDHNPPPRIFIVYKDGRRVEFTGKDFDPNKITALEFANSGEGLRPDYLQAMLHGGDEKTLGKHGRGMKVALTYLTGQGMPIEIESHVPEHGNWKCRTVLRPTLTGRTKILGGDGEWLQGKRQETIFRIQNPKEEIVALLKNLPEHFLPANPEYKDAIIVKKGTNAKRPTVEFVLKDHDIERRVQCLKGIVPHETKNQETVFVDGLRVDYRGRKFLYPWNIENFSSADWPLNVTRSPDSETVSQGSPETLVQAALKHSKDQEILKELIEISVSAKMGEYDLPAELSSNSYSSSLKETDQETKQLLKTIWEKQFGNSYIARNDDEMARLKVRRPEVQVRVVKGAMYDWLRESGVLRVEDALGVEKMQEIESGKPIKVEYAKKEDALEELFKEAGTWLGDVRVIEEKGKKCLMVRFSHSVESDADFYDRNKPGAQWARVAAVVAKEHGLDISIESRRPDKKHSLEFTVTQNPWQRNKSEYDTKLHVATQQDSEVIAGEFVTVMMRGQEIQQLDPPPEGKAAKLAKMANEKAREILAQRIEKLSAMPQVNKKSKPEKKTFGEESGSEGMDRRKFLKVAAGALAAGAIGYYFYSNREKITGGNVSVGEAKGSGWGSEGPAENIGNPQSALGVQELEYRSGTPRRDEMELQSGDFRHGIDGYYRRSIGTRFVLSEGLGARGRGFWVNPENFEVENIPQEEPIKYGLVTKFNRLQGQARLPIRSGEMVLGILSRSPVEVLRERRGGNYVLRGFAGNGELLVYTGPDRKGEQLSEPIDDEKNSLLGRQFGSIDHDWQLLIARLLSDKKITFDQKAAVVLEKWGREYTYTDDSRFDSQVRGSSTEEITSQIINMKKGMCNTAAHGYVAILREAGVPARTVIGQVNDGHTFGSGHMWAEYWNGKAWKEIETLSGSQVDPELRAKEERYFATLSVSRQVANANQLVKREGRTIEEIKRQLQRLPKRTEKSKQAKTQPQDSSADLEKKVEGIIEHYAAPTSIGIGIGAGLKAWWDRFRKNLDE
ncbi:transglutaminase domain-containing protein [bacterium]|nr:MAG: transglutaminase domain-containing protein [bacterium]